MLHHKISFFINRLLKALLDGGEKKGAKISIWQLWASNLPASATISIDRENDDKNGSDANGINDKLTSIIKGFY